MSTSPPLVVADRYRLVAPLGQGGMGRVWRATDVVLHRDVAIKELVPPPGLTPEERREMRERSLREARAIARLNNINVVRVFDVLRTDADPWIVMEYVPSRSLQDILAADGPFQPVRAAEIGLGVLNALRAAHRAGVVHRDVKPGNVLIGQDSRVVLTDFGLATVPGDPNVTRTGLVLGSPAYISPERARDGTAGPGADLWSLGATLYAAVEGASPFARPSAIATLAALATENPPPARNAGPLKPVLNGLLRKDPAHRINADEAERLLLRATGRRSKLSFPMSPTMRRPGVGRERPALPGSTPVVPGAPTVQGSAPVVPGPRPPVTPARPTSPPPAPGRSPAISRPAASGPADQGATPGSGGRGGSRTPGDEGRGGRAGGTATGPEGRPPVFAPGKAPVGRPARPSDASTHVDGPKVEAPSLDATRLDTPPVRSTSPDQPLSGTGTPARDSAGPATPPAGTGPSTPSQGALGRGTRGVFGTLSAAEIAAHRRRARQNSEAGGPAAEESAAPVASGGAATEAPDRAGTERSAGESAPDRVGAEDPANEAGPGRTAAEQAALERAAAQWIEREQAASGRPGTGTSAAPSQRPAAEVADEWVESRTRDTETSSGTAAKASTARDTELAAQPAEAEAAAHGDAQQDKSGQGAGPVQADAPAEPTDDTGSAGAAAKTATGGQNKPAVGARAGAGSGNRASRKKGRGRSATGGAKIAAAGSTSAAAASTPAADAEAIASAEPLNAAAAEGEGLTSGSATGAEGEGLTGESATGAEGEGLTSGSATAAGDESVASTETETDAGEEETAAEAGPKVPMQTAAAVVEAELPAAPPRRSPKVAAARSGERKVTTASLSSTKNTGTPATSDAGTAVIGVPPARTGATAGTTDAQPGVLGFNGSSRPAWTPMPVRPRSPGANGLTVFGTTLSRRQTVIGLAILLAIAVALVVMVPLAFRDDGKGSDNRAVPAPVGSGKAATTAPAPPAQSPTSQPASAKPTPTPASSAPAAGGGSVTLPAGWYMYKDSTGFSVPIPVGSSIRRQGSEVYFRKNNRLLIVDQTDQPQPDPVADWKNQEADRRGRVYRNYQRIKIVPVKYFTKAADWEFLYTTDSGNPQHAVKRGVITSPKQAYGISWYTSPGDWSAAQKDLQLIYQGFRPKA